MVTDKSQSTPSWQADPFGRHEQRYWNGQHWTEKVMSNGIAGIDPPGIVPKPEHARSHIPARPIVDSASPISYRSKNLSLLIVVGVMMLAALIVLLVLGITLA